VYIAAAVAVQQNRFFIRQMYPFRRQVAAACFRKCIKTARKIPFCNPSSFVHNMKVLTTSQKFNLKSIQEIRLFYLEQKFAILILDTIMGTHNLA
jgi:hypothetical protein